MSPMTATTSAKPLLGVMFNASDDARPFVLVEEDPNDLAYAIYDAAQESPRVPMAWCYIRSQALADQISAQYAQVMEYLEAHDPDQEYEETDAGRSYLKACADLRTLVRSTAT